MRCQFLLVKLINPPTGIYGNVLAAWQIRAIVVGNTNTGALEVLLFED